MSSLAAPTPNPLAIQIANLSVAGTAEYLKVSQSYLNKLRCAGGGPAYFKIGGRVVYPIADLDAWLSKRRRTSTSDTGDEAA